MGNNMIGLTGMISSPVEFSHSVGRRSFYKTMLDVKRLSGTVDTLPLTLPEGSLEISRLQEGERVSLRGQMRSYNHHEGERNHLILSVYVEEIRQVSEQVPDSNELTLRGYICKPPVLRKTPLGRKACDLLVAVGRNYGRSDYLPVIAWGRTAEKAAAFPVGMQIEGTGRMQSRAYTKRFADGRCEERTAYEVSLMRAEAVDSTVQEV
ncbi:MAG: single-stranded DNA-binding protein [Lachnospiraceae bacterium]|nr:single-stranded DNA-binding protein [Lachnospiraceae bacterium]MCH4030244.1 single-stranded DNA-binding protein [Lachnospiraceae bacterium]MCH4069456.1 single-stranded DNA-binding protein [Lachnospiraceae bacterium]MCH4107608.1 single-stranded DNA-binding protein [Lachnospiraceae bacterium]MCI1301541.1 single-stranded DNA-binding protein [Lachnospiraceae bacterium]